MNVRLREAYEERMGIDRQAFKPAYGMMAGVMLIFIASLIFFFDARLLAVMIFTSMVTIIQAIALHDAVRVPGPRYASLSRRTTLSVLPWYVIVLASAAVFSTVAWGVVPALFWWTIAVSAVSLLTLALICWNSMTPSLLLSQTPGAAAFVDGRMRMRRAASGLVALSLPLLMFSSTADRVISNPTPMQLIADFAPIAVLALALFLMMRTRSTPTQPEFLTLAEDPL